MDPAVRLSLLLAGLTTAALLLVGVPFAYWLAFSRHPLKPVFEALIALPLVLPPTVLGFYLLLAMGPHALVGRAWEALFQARLVFSFSGLAIASIFYSLPFAVQPIQAAFQGLSPRLLEAASTLGAGPWRTFWRVIAPASRAGLVAGAVLSFAHTLGEFGVALMVGGNIPGVTRTVSIAIFDRVEALDYTGAGRLSLGLLVASYLALVALYAAQRRPHAPWPAS